MRETHSEKLSGVGTAMDDTKCSGRVVLDHNPV
jgi:hypothetical protein